MSCLKASLKTRKIGHFLRLAPPGEGLTWPLLTTSGTELKWMNSLAYLYSQYGFTNVLVDVQLRKNYENSTEHIFKLKNPKIDKLFDYGAALRILFDLNIVARLPLLQNLKKLESDIQNLAKFHDNGNIQVMSVEQLSRRTGCEWQEFIQTIVGPETQPSFRLEVENFDYFIALKRLIDSTDAELLGNYIMIQFAIFLQEEIEDGGYTIDCIKYVRRNMYVAASILIMERFVPHLPMFHQKIEKIFEEIRQQLLLQIEHNRLGLTSKQKDMVSRKIRATILNVGNLPSRSHHREFLNKYYEDLEIPVADKDFAREHLNLLRFNTRKTVTQLNESVLNANMDFILPEPARITSSGPYYLSPENVIVLPVELLQEPSSCWTATMCLHIAQWALFWPGN
ncbi:uncharacterized protein LOC128257901 [Drosophila gunungcola]|uniref:uncharacterized protein LOC128257901 n=1 Tax=Drosophila gunungcola TaxID=103775 RepID=UPI0022E88F2C|nr:uncharacterized protein LOC128257901 [Drosophila gunungcola]